MARRRPRPQERADDTAAFPAEADVGGVDTMEAPIDSSETESSVNTRLDEGPDEIARRAYERYQERGGEHGHDQEDWFEAEREVRERRRGGR